MQEEIKMKQLNWAVLGCGVIANEMAQALEHMGFCLSEEALIGGHDGTKYNSYYFREV